MMFQELRMRGSPLHDDRKSDDVSRGARGTGDAEDAGSQAGKADGAKSQSQKDTKSLKAKKPAAGELVTQRMPASALEAPCA